VFQSRDEVRRVYLQVWRKMQQGDLLEPMESLIAEVIEIHPEYHALLDDADSATDADFSPEQGRTNPFLHMGMHIALREQAAGDRPAGVRPVYQRLCASLGRHEAEHAMMECLGRALWSAQRNGEEPDLAGYLDCLKKL
jgi:hypothetical protein